jgi:hypothetical protein
VLGFVSYLLHVDRKTWTAFRAKLEKDDRKVGETLYALIRQYISQGLDETRKDR